MKKLLAVLAILMMALPAVAADPIAAYQFTITWEPVTLNLMDKTIPAEQVTYDVFVTDKTLDPGKQNPQLVLSRVLDTSATVTLLHDGSFVAGVEAVRALDGQVVSRSGIVWMDEFTENPTAIVHYSIRKTGKVTVVK